MLYIAKAEEWRQAKKIISNSFVENLSSAYVFHEKSCHQQQQQKKFLFNLI